MVKDSYDVAVIGGGAAGLGAALTLARARRSVLVVDDGTPRNAPAGHVHNYLTRDGTPPSELLAAGRAEVAGYGGEIVDGRVVTARRTDDGTFTVELADGGPVRARRVIVTTGLVDELPDVPGLASRWGRDVLHCPYCHGWEVRDRSIAVLATTTAWALHQALLFRQLSSDITVLLHTASDPDPDERERLDARGIRVVSGKVAEIEVTGDRLSGVRLVSGEVVGCDALVVAPRFVARTEVFTGLGLHPREHVVNGHVLGSAIPADPSGATDVPGVWVAGNVTNLAAQVIGAAAGGVATAGAVNADLVEEDTRLAVEQRRRRHDASSTEDEREA